MVYFASNRVVNASSPATSSHKCCAPKPRVKGRSVRKARGLRAFVMVAQRKIFRIEQMAGDGAADSALDFRVLLEDDSVPVSEDGSVPDIDQARRHNELVTEIKALRALV